MKTILFLFFTLSQIIFSQAFKISTVPSGGYTIDHITGDVYYYHGRTGDLYKTNIKTMETSPAYFTSPPEFANKSHFAVYLDVDGMYKYDFEKDTSYLIIEDTYWNNSSEIGKSLSLESTGYSISPNDRYVFYKKYDEKIFYYDLKLKEAHPLGGKLYSEQLEWAGDSSIIYLSYGQEIIHYNFVENVEDTLLPEARYTGFSYNKTNQTIAYSIHQIYPKIHIYDLNSDKDTVVYDFEIKDELSSHCTGAAVDFTSLTWSKDDKELAFFNFGNTISSSGIYSYNLDSGKSYRHTVCDDYGLKYFLEWFNNDTLIYLNTTDNSVYGFETLSPIATYIKTEKSQNNLIEELSTNVYPNPFNPSTKIKYTIPESGIIKITIYDMLGRKIIDLVDEYHSAGEYEINLDAGKYGLSSGNYIYRLKSGKIAVSKMFTFIK